MSCHPGREDCILGGGGRSKPMTRCPEIPKTIKFDVCVSRKDHHSTKDFQLINPGDSYFYALGLPGYIYIHPPRLT